MRGEEKRGEERRGEERRREERRGEERRGEERRGEERRGEERRGEERRGENMGEWRGEDVRGKKRGERRTDKREIYERRGGRINIGRDKRSVEECKEGGSPGSESTESRREERGQEKGDREGKGVQDERKTERGGEWKKENRNTKPIGVVAYRRKHHSVSSVKEFTAIGILLLWAGSCLSENDGFPVRMPGELCKPCHGQVQPGTNQLRCQRNQRTKPEEVTEEVVKEMKQSLKTAKYHVNEELNTLRELYSIPDNLSSLVRIDGLTDIENSSFKKHFKSKNKPLNLMHQIYTRTSLLSAFTEALGRIYKKNSRPSDSLENITHELLKVACTTKSLAVNLGLKQIKKKLRKELCSFRDNLDPIRITDYETSILDHGYKLLNESIEDLDELVNVTNSCTLICKRSGKLKLKCGGRKEPRRLGKARKGKKGRRCRNSKKNRKGKNDVKINKRKNCRGEKNNKKGGKGRKNSRRNSKKQRIA